MIYLSDRDLNRLSFFAASLVDAPERYSTLIQQIQGDVSPELQVAINIMNEFVGDKKVSIEIINDMSDSFVIIHDNIREQVGWILFDALVAADKIILV